MTKRLKLVAAVVTVLAVVGLVIWFIPRPPCETGEYSRLVGVGVDVQLEQVKALQATLGLSDSLVKGLDTVLRDYSAKYDNACRDVTQGLITLEQYQCMRQQIERNLDSARRVRQALDAATSGADPAAQRAILQTAVDELERAREAGFDDSCIPGLEVAPKQVIFKGNTTVGFFTLLNRGPLPLTFSITEYPDGFIPRRTTGTVPASDDVDIVIKRTIDPLPPARPLHARIKVGSRNDLAVEFLVDTQNARLWEDLADRLRQSPNGAPSVASALVLIDETIPRGVELPVAERQALAATALFAGRFHREAQDALQQAVDADRALAQNAGVLKLAAAMTAERPEAQPLYAQIRSAQPTYEESVAAHGTHVSGLVLGQVRVTQQLTADGKVLPPGTYEVRLRTIDPAATPDAPADAAWIEFLQNNTVKGRELATEVPTGVNVKPRFNLDMLRRPDHTNLWVDTGATKYIVNLPTAQRPQS